MLSTGYLLHLLNVLLLLSPAGIILFLFTIKRIHSPSYAGEFLLAMLWFSIGGFSVLLLVSPQTLYAWDIYAWSSAGYVIIGAYLYITSPKENNSPYRAVIIAAHSLIYLSAWISLNNNSYAAVLNYLDAVPSQFKNQVAVTLEMTCIDIRDRAAFSRLVQDLEKKAQSKEDFKWILFSYEALQDSVNHERISARVSELYFQAIEKEPDNARHYYDLYRGLPSSVVYNPANRKRIEPYYLKPVELEPANLTYYMYYGSYLERMGDIAKAAQILKRADSLFTGAHMTPFETNFEQADVKSYLALLSYRNDDWLECARYFEECVQCKSRSTIYRFQNALGAAIMSYCALGNGTKAGLIRERYSFNSIDDKTIQGLSQKSRKQSIRVLAAFLNSGDDLDLNRFLLYGTKDAFIPEYEVFRCLQSLREGEYKEFQEYASGIIQYNAAFPMAHLLSGIGHLHTGNISAAISELLVEMERIARSDTCTWVDCQVLRFCDSHIDSLLRDSNLPPELMTLLKGFSMEAMSTGSSQYSRTLDLMDAIIASLESQSYPAFISLIGKTDAQARENIGQLIDYEVQVGHFMYQHTQQAMAANKKDSLAIYADLMIQLIPSQFQGYFLKGITYKNARIADSARAYFQAAIDKLPNSRLLANPDATRQRIESMMESKE